VESRVVAAAAVAVSAMSLEQFISRPGWQQPDGFLLSNRAVRVTQGAGEHEGKTSTSCSCWHLGLRAASYRVVLHRPSCFRGRSS